MPTLGKEVLHRIIVIFVFALAAHEATTAVDSKGIAQDPVIVSFDNLAKELLDQDAMVKLVKNLVDNLIDELLVRRRQTSSINRATLDNVTLLVASYLEKPSQAQHWQAHRPSLVRGLLQKTFGYLGNPWREYGIKDTVMKEARQFSDISMFRIGPSKIHGNGVLLTRPLRAGELAGLQWFEYTPSMRVFHNTPYNILFWPPECGCLPKEYRRRPSTSPTEAGLSPELMRACFCRAVNHNCTPTCEIFVKTFDPSELPQVVARINMKKGTPLRGFYLKALRDLEEGDEITYNYLTAPNYIWKEPHVVAGCTKDGPATPSPPPF